jgi:uncharacterized protein
MLIEFSVENYRSIKDRVTLSMVASDEEQLSGNLIAIEGETGQKLLKTAVLYGANASGKTNVLKAFEFMVDFVVNSHRIQKGDEIETVPFLLDEEMSEEPSVFVVMFYHEGMKYAYGFTCDRKRVYEEYLYAFLNGEQKMIFERFDTDVFEFEEDEQEQEALSKRTLENRLYLSTATQFNYERTAKAFEWFKSEVEMWVDLEQLLDEEITAQMILKDKDFGEVVTHFLANADTGICGIEVFMKPRRAGQNSFRPFLIKKFRVYVDHKLQLPNGEERIVTFPLEEESRGTQRMFEMLGPWIQALRKGKLLVIDELENSLHPLLMEQLVKLFHSTAHNKNGAQLLFTTHNTNLIDETIYRRDQIWLTDKAPSTGSTNLYSLLRFKRVPDQDLEKGYLAGRFGAVPFFKGDLLV